MLSSRSIVTTRKQNRAAHSGGLPGTRIGVVLGTVLILCNAAGVSAQDPGRIKAEVRVGGAAPVGELDAFLAGGPSLWIGGRYLLNDRFAILAEGGRSYFRGMVPSGRPQDDPAHRYETDTRFQRLLVGTEVAIAPFDREPVGASIRVTTGRVSHSVEAPGFLVLCAPPARAELLEDAWTGGLGMRLSYELRTNARVSVTADLIGAFQDVDDHFVEPRYFTCQDEQFFMKGFGFPLTFPVTLGLSVGI